VIHSLLSQNVPTRRPSYVSTLAGDGTCSLLCTPKGLSVNPNDGSVFVADAGSNNVLRVPLVGQLSLYAGTGVASSLDGPVATATLAAPQGVAYDAPSGRLFVTDYAGLRVVGDEPGPPPNPPPPEPPAPPSPSPPLALAGGAATTGTVVFQDVPVDVFAANQAVFTAQALAAISAALGVSATQVTTAGNAFQGDATTSQLAYSVYDSQTEATTVAFTPDATATPVVLRSQSILVNAALMPSQAYVLAFADSLSAFLSGATVLPKGYAAGAGDNGMTRLYFDVVFAQGSTSTSDEAALQGITLTNDFSAALSGYGIMDMPMSSAGPCGTAPCPMFDMTAVDAAGGVLAPSFNLSLVFAEAAVDLAQLGPSLAYALCSVVGCDPTLTDVELAEADYTTLMYALYTVAFYGADAATVATYVSAAAAAAPPGQTGALAQALEAPTGAALFVLAEVTLIADVLPANLATVVIQLSNVSKTYVERSVGAQLAVRLALAQALGTANSSVTLVAEAALAGDGCVVTASVASAGDLTMPTTDALAQALALNGLAVESVAVV